MRNDGDDKNFYYQEIKRRILSGIKSGEYSPGDKIPTIRKFANDLGCSLYPARMAISELAFEGDLEIRHGSGVYVRAKERQLDNQNRLIALIAISLVDDASNFSSRVLSALQNHFAERNIAVTLMIKGSSIEAESRWLDFCLEQKFEGIVIQANKQAVVNPRVVEAAKKISIVHFDGAFDGVHSDFVVNDDSHAVREAMDFLFALGHRHIAFYCPTGGENVESRKSSYLGALKERGIEFDSRLILESSSSSGSVMDFFASGKAVTAILCHNDYAAQKAYEELSNFGLKIPEDVSIFGFGDIDFGQYLSPPLSTISQFPEKVGQVAAEALLARIENPSAISKNIKIPTRLIHRGSVRKASAVF